VCVCVCHDVLVAANDVIVRARDFGQRDEEPSTSPAAGAPPTRGRLQESISAADLRNRRVQIRRR